MREFQRNLLDLAGDQHGLVTRRQAEAGGLSRSAVDRMLRNGLVVPVTPGVFRVRGAVQTTQMAMMAATLATKGHVSHETALHVLRLADTRFHGPLHLTVDVEQFRPRAARVCVAATNLPNVDVRVHRCQTVAKRIVHVDGIPCADAARALIDAAPSLSSLELESAFERARQLGLVSIEGLAA